MSSDRYFLELTGEEKAELLTREPFIFKRAWNRLFTKLTPMLFRAIKQRRSDLTDQDVEEIIATAFITALKYLPGEDITVQYEPVRAIYANASNALVDWTRKKHAGKRDATTVPLDTVSPDPAADASVEPSISESEVADTLISRAAILPPLQKLAMQAFLSDPDLTAREIAENISQQLGHLPTPESVNSALRAASLKLRPFARILKREINR